VTPNSISALRKTPNRGRANDRGGEWYRIRKEERGQRRRERRSV